jgi:hypothetical protein
MPEISNSISSFLTNFYGGTRVNRFEITANNCDTTSKGTGGLSTGQITAAETKYHIRAASIPGASISPINLNWFGRSIPIPGERVNDLWTITVLDDRPINGQFSLYQRFKSWQKKVVDWGTDITVDISGIKDCSWTVKHYSSGDQSKFKDFTLKQVWPVTVGGFALDMTQDNVLATFTVQLAFSHMSYNYV